MAFPKGFYFSEFSLVTRNLTFGNGVMKAAMESVTIVFGEAELAEESGT